MGALERLYAALEPLRLYALHGNSLVDRELEAYGAGFAVLEERMESLVRNAFVQTADNGALEQYERQVGLVSREEADPEKRRENVLYRMGEAAGCFTMERIADALRVLGMEAELIPDIPGEFLEIRCVELTGQTPDLDRLKNSVLAILPAHLEVQFNIGEMTWDMFDETEIDWDDWDLAHFNWTEFDINGHNILTRKGS